jgi:paraquat-inducible protein A
VAIAAAIVTIVVPAIQIVTLTWVLTFALKHRSCPCFILAMLILRVARPWGMTEVWLLGIIVAIVKLSGYLHVIVGVGVWATVLLAPTMTVITSRGYGELWRLFERAK